MRGEEEGASEGKQGEVSRAFSDFEKQMPECPRAYQCAEEAAILARE
jgi:hypothetical protein